MKAETLDNILGEALEAAGVYRAADVIGGLVLIPCSSIKPGNLTLIS